MKRLIRSPLNYTGNKYRVLEQIIPHFPSNMKCMVDLFCGGATVGLNVEADRVIFVDNNEKVVHLLKYLSFVEFDRFIKKLEFFIKKYDLSYSAEYGYQVYKQKCSDNSNNGLKKYNLKGYDRLKNDYNSLKNTMTENSFVMLYLLMLYGFNNDIRFNADGNFNLPCGKTDLNKANIQKIKSYIERVHNMNAEFICASFDSYGINSKIEKADFIYMDPPYLITNAVYNNGWNNNSEYKLLSFIDSLIVQNKQWALSNVLSKLAKKGNSFFEEKNEPLNYWLYLNNSKVKINNIMYNYKSSSYNKRLRDAKEVEVLITYAGK